MKFKAFGYDEIFEVRRIKTGEKTLGFVVKNREHLTIYEEGINWETTRKLNEVKTENNKIEPFELKEGMKFVAKQCLNDLEVSKVEKLEKSNRYLHGNLWFYESQIDWEATRKLNPLGLAKPKNDIYIIWNPKGNNPKQKHYSIEDAEKEAERLATENHNQEFYVLKSVGTVKGTVKVEWEK